MEELAGFPGKLSLHYIEKKNARDLILKRSNLAIYVNTEYVSMILCLCQYTPFQLSLLTIINIDQKYQNMKIM